MRLANLRVRNYRSYFTDKPGPSVELALGSGVNYLAGPNNCGKSNLLRAIALALDPKGNPYHAEHDRPQAKRADTQTTVTLEFHLDERVTGPLDTLRKRVDAYERTVADFREPSLASQGVLRFHVQCGDGQRQESFLARSGALRGDPEELAKALDQFRKVVRFVDIRSGEELKNLLERGFKEVLGTVLGEERSTAIDDARRHRDAYVEALGQALRPLARHVQERISKYVRDVEEVDLQPVVPLIEDSIAGARFVIKDAIATDLDQKGTGVRGATLLTLLSFIAESSKRAVVFAIEEPESFLHPEAHRALGLGLEDFTQRSDVSLLVTTHSPFLFREERLERSKLFEVTKTAEGRSQVDEPTAARATRARLLGSQVYAELLGRAETVRDDARLVLVVEGWTDKRYLEIVAALTSRRIDHLDIVVADGAMPAAMQATTLLGLVGDDRPIVVLFDDDEDGKRAHNTLDKWANKLVRLRYDKWIQAKNVPVEAEDMFSNALIERFLGDVGSDGHTDGQNQRPKTKTWHYSLTDAGKLKLIDWLPKNATADDCRAWGELLTHLDTLVDKAAQRAARSAERQDDDSLTGQGANARRGGDRER